MHSEKHRTEVEGGLVAVRRQELEVILDAESAHLDEEVLVRSRDTEEFGGTLHTRCILVRAEYSYTSVFLAEGLQTLEAGNRIMEDLGERVKSE